MKIGKLENNFEHAMRFILQKKYLNKMINTSEQLQKYNNKKNKLEVN